MVSNGVYSMTYDGEGFTGTEAEYNAFKAAHNLEDGHIIYLICA